MSIRGKKLKEGDVYTEVQATDLLAEANTMMMMFLVSGLEPRSGRYIAYNEGFSSTECVVTAGKKDIRWPCCKQLRKRVQRQLYGAGKGRTTVAKEKENAGHLSVSSVAKQKPLKATKRIKAMKDEIEELSEEVLEQHIGTPPLK